MQEKTGAGDPLRTLTLLWRHHARHAPTGTSGEQTARRKGLDVDAIVDAAIALADADGVDGVSMRKVAERLGVGTMSLYTHVPGKSELIELMVDQVFGELYPEGSPGNTWRKRLEAIAQANWELYRRHPWLLQISQARPTLGPHASAKYEIELSAIDGIGLCDLDMDAVIALINGHVEAAARGWLGMREIAEQTGMDDAQWWEASAPVLEELIDGSKFPISGRVGSAAGQEYQSATSPQRALSFGLGRILDGVAILIDER